MCFEKNETWKLQTKILCDQNMLLENFGANAYLLAHDLFFFNLKFLHRQRMHVGFLMF